MSKPNIFKTSTGEELELRRPTYKAFKPLANKVGVLMEVPFEAAMSTPEFAQVLNACVVQQLGNPEVEDDDGILSNLPYNEAAALWDAVMEYCEFPSFFAERQQQHSVASRTQMELEVSLQAAQIAAMKKSGLLPETFSLENALSEETNHLTNPANLLSLPTTTDESTAGRSSKSKTPTTGSSSATSPKRRSAAAQSKDS